MAILAGALRAASGVPVALSAAAGGLVGGRGRGGVAGLAAGLGLARLGAGDGLVRAVAQRWPSFGLCGGMALAAIERWPARGRVPTSELRPGPLRALLRRRQETTLRASLPAFARHWLRARLPGNTPEGPFAADLRRQLDAVETALGSGRPALVGVVGDAPDPFSQHQVVVFGIERRGPLDATLDVYDPNAPGKTRHITTASAGGSRTQISTDLTTGRGADGRARISTRPGHLAHLFVIDA